jgi:hypothetical protein
MQIQKQIGPRFVAGIFFSVIVEAILSSKNKEDFAVANSSVAIRIRDRVPFSTPRSGTGKNKDQDPG